MVTGVVPSSPPVLAFNLYRAKGSAIPLPVDFLSSIVANSRSREQETLLLADPDWVPYLREIGCVLH